jgi:hypothetical protein
MSKKAFVVGINNFQGDIPHLQGCINDTSAMQEVLKTYFDFQDSDMKIIRDGEATSQGIRAGLTWLLDDAKAGDVRIFHFSSHGTQVPDEKGEEPDGADEVIVPYDHDWNKPFKDDDLRAIFDAIPEGVNFTFIADCCHSGSIQKGLLDRGIEFSPRYVTPPPALVDRIAELKQQRRDVALESDAEELLNIMDQLQDVPKEQRMQKAKEILAAHHQSRKQNKFGISPDQAHFTLAACEDRQTAADARIEGDFHGAFTWALTQAVKDTGGDLTYDDVIQRIGDNLKLYDQIPQVACPEGVRTAKLFAPLV